MARRNWTIEEIEWLREHYPKYGMNYCAEFLKRTPDVIRAKATALKIRRAKTPEQMAHIHTFLLENYHKLGVGECERVLGVPPATLPYHVKKLNLVIDKKILSERLRNSILPTKGGEKVNYMNFRHIDNEYKAYICGILFSDGSVRSNHTVVIRAARHDLVEILPVFLTTGKWTFKDISLQKKYDHYKDISDIYTCNIKLIELFREYGYYDKSINSPTLILNAIPSHLHYMFWRGLCDGDGSCGKKTFNIAAHKNYDFSEMEKVFASLAISPVNIYRTSVKTSSGKDGGYSHITFNKKSNILKWYNYLYPQDSLKLGYSRKHNQYIECLMYKGHLNNPSKLSLESKEILKLNLQKW